MSNSIINNAISNIKKYNPLRIFVCSCRSKKDFIHVTPLSNLKGIIDEEKINTENIIKTILNGGTVVCNIKLNPTKDIYKNLSVLGSPNEKNGFIYGYVEPLSKLSIFLNLCGRSKTKKNACLIINGEDIKGVRLYRWIDGTHIISGDYNGKAQITLLYKKL